MKRFKIIVKGEVQKVGYRDFVQEIARKLKIFGYVENLKDGNVKIVCECEENILRSFLDKIKIKKGLINVEEIEIKEERATGEFRTFEIKYGLFEEEMIERMSTAIKYASVMWETMNETLKEIKETRLEVKKVGEKVDDVKLEVKKVGEKVDDVKLEVKKVGEKVDDVKLEVKKVGNKVDSVREEIKEFRSDMKRYMDERFRKIEREIEIIKEKIGLK